ncbi:MAG: lytic transglycosylase domain-containing protein [Bacteroidales bacterium]|nr:lytic transglycosylase domain-containing protein [Bacteroidales bacterium]
MEKKKQHTIGNISVILGFFLALFVLIIFTGSGKNNGGSSEDNAKNEDFYSVTAVKIPDKLDFAGEPVPLDNFDTRESLDRELLVNTFYHSQTFLLIKRANRFFPIIEPILKKYGIPDDIKYISLIESNLENAVSPKQAVGFWQLMEGTARDYGLEVNKEVDERYHLEKSTEVACKFFLESFKKYNNWTLTAASYNAGRLGIDRQIDRQDETSYYDMLLNEETARYVFRALAIKLIMNNPENYGFNLNENDRYPVIPTYDIKIDSSISNMSSFAKSLGLNYKIIKYFNPWLRETYLTNRNRSTYLLKFLKKDTEVIS